MAKHVAATIALAAITILLAGAIGQALSPGLVFEGSTTTRAKDGAPLPVHVSVQSWGIAGERGPNGLTHEIPLRGFYVAHLLSGHISAKINNQTTDHLPGAYWTVKAGATMQVKVLGEFAVLETIVVAKQ